MRSIVLVVVVGGLGACTLDGSSVEEDFSSLEEQVAGQAIVSLTWDDALADQQVAVDLLDAHGMHGTFYVISGRLGGTGNLSSSQIIEWQQQGHEIGGHTVNHLDLTTLAPDDVRRQVCNDRVALLGMGLVVTSFAYPFGASNALAEQVADECGYNSARGVGDVNNPIPPTDPFDLHTPPSVKPETTLAQIQGYVTAAEPAGRWVPIVFHHVCDGCATNAVSPATLDAFLDWLQANGKVVRTVDEVMGGDVQPGVPGPPSGSNLLANPSLEVDANGDAVPDCWQRGGTGTSTATYTLTGTAHDGAVAQRIDVNSVTAGAARRLVSKQDTGACAPAAQPGHQFRVSAFYLANAQPRFTVYYRASSGAWTFWTQGPLLPSSASYVAASFVTPPLPAGASAISVGLSLYSVGSITMDQFALVETDTTRPTAAVSSPAAGAHVTGIAPIVAATTDNVGVVRVRFYLDGAQLGTRTVVPFRWNWNTATTTRGAHTVAVQAEDAAGNATRSPNVPVTVD